MKEEKNVKEMQFLAGFKSYAGIIFYISVIGMILALIGTFCPMCSYNPTIFDESKRVVKLIDLSFVGIIGLIFFVSAIVIALYVVNSLTKKDWRERKKKYTVCAVLVLIFILLSFTIITIACTFYRIPEQEFDYLEVKEETGYYLYVIGSFIFSLAFFFYCVVLKKIAEGKVELEAIAIGKKKVDGKIDSTSNSLSEKLLELQKMKDFGIITEDEYYLKKEELLRNFK